MLASAVVDAVEQVDVALYAPQLLFRLARRVDKLGLVGAEAVNEPLPVVLAVVQLHEVDDTLNDFRSQGIGVAAPCFQQDGERFLILPQAGRQLELCWRTSREFHPSEDLSKLRTGVSLWADGIMAGTACQSCLGLSGYRSAPYLAVL